MTMAVPSNPQQTFATLVHGGKVVTSGGVLNLDIGINDGLISYLGVSQPTINANRKIDASDLNIISTGLRRCSCPSERPGQKIRKNYSAP